eukprot:c23109_g1_i1 orf=934-2460(+)
MPVLSASGSVGRMQVPRFQFLFESGLLCQLSATYFYHSLSVICFLLQQKACCAFWERWSLIMSGEPLGVSPTPSQPVFSSESHSADQMAAHSVGEEQQHLYSPQRSLTPPTQAHPASAAQTGRLVYPPVLAKHEAVAADRDLFFDTLNKFHAALGTRLMIPTIGGKELDLHLLYVEVSSRGGLEQVIKDRKWKEVTVAFNFPPTTTSASFVLRKYYMSLLHHYEQVYFFGVQGQLVPPPAPLPAPNSAHQASDNGFSNTGMEEGGPAAKKRRRKITLDPICLYGVDPGASVGHTVSGVIDGKIDHGYLVTVTLGAEKLRGVLYHMPTGSIAPQFASVPDLTANVSFDLSSEVRKRKRRRRKDEMPKKDPNAPKPNKSGYNFFFQEQHLRLKALYPDKDKEISRMIGEQWNKLTEDEKAVYQDRGIKDKERYKKEMAEYHERLRSQVHHEGGGLWTGESLMQFPPENIRQEDNCNLDSDKAAVIGEVDMNSVNSQKQQKPKNKADDLNA